MLKPFTNQIRLRPKIDICTRNIMCTISKDMSACIVVYFIQIPCIVRKLIVSCMTFQRLVIV